MAGRKQTATSAARSTSRRAKRVTVSTEPKAQKSSPMDYFRFGESYTSLILGIVVVIIASILLVSFLRGRALELNDSDKGASSTQTSTQDAKTYTVQAGDDLWNIAEQEYNDGFQWNKIAEANDIQNPNSLEVGTKLEIPASTTAQVQESQSTLEQVPMTQPEVTESPVTAEKITQDSYTVKSGDVLWDVAIRAYGDGYQWVRIADANNLVNPNVIHAGNQLVIPRS
jgi:nucleoid-associated protein YgaU